MEKLFLISHKEEKLSQVLYEQAQANKKIKVLELAQFLLKNSYEEKITLKNEFSFFPHSTVFLRVFSTPSSVLNLFHPSEHEYINFEVLAFLESLKEFSNVRSTLGQGPLCTWNQSLIEIWETAKETVPSIKTPYFEYPSNQDTPTSKRQDWIYSSPNYIYEWRPSKPSRYKNNAPSLLKYLRPEGEAVHVLSSQKKSLILNTPASLETSTLNKIKKVAQTLTQSNSSWIEEHLYFANKDGEVTLAFRSPKISSSVPTPALFTFTKQTLQEL